MIVYIIISLLAFYGFFHLLQDITMKIKTGSRACCGKLCLFPQPGDKGLELKIRCIFSNEISEKLGTDGCLYVIMDENDPNRPMMEKLCCEYPRLVLLDHTKWGRMDPAEVMGEAKGEEQ